MFGQIVPWYDCNNNCTFCSQQNLRENLTVSDKKRRLMKASHQIAYNGADYTKFGVMGGELFDTEGLDREWRCVASSLASINATYIFLTSHLMQPDISQLERVLELLKGRKNLVVCTSWDKKGRFHTKESLDNWHRNVQRLHSLGYIINCTSILTQDLVTTEPDIPEYVQLSVLEPSPSYKFWCEGYDKDKEGDAREILLNTVPQIGLNPPKRQDTLDWMSRHKDTCVNLQDYVFNHSSDIYEWVDGDYVKTVESRFSKHCESCGHPYGFRCYADSPNCLLCDIKEKFKW